MRNVKLPAALGVLAILATVVGPASAARPVPRAQQRFEALSARATAAMLVDPRTALPIVAEAESVARALPDRSARAIDLASAERLRAEAMIRLNRPDDAAPVVARALALIAPLHGALKVRGDLLLSRGAIHSIQADFGAALADYLAAHAIFRDVREPRSQAIALSCIAWIYREARDYPTALKYYQQSADAYGDDPTLLVTLNNSMGMMLFQLGKFGEAQQRFATALEAARQLKSPMMEATILRNLARGQLKAGNLDAADRTIAAGLAISRRTDAGTWREQFLGVAAQAALQRGNLAEARELVEQSFAGVDLTTTALPFREGHETAYDVYRRLGEQGLAIRHLEAMKRLDDQTARLVASTNTALMAARFDSANQQLTIAKNKIAYEQSQKRFQQLLFVGIALATATLIAVLSAGLFTSRRSRLRLASSNTALEKALAAKTEFLATTSHEIRTPLNGILGMTQVMLADRTLPAATRERIDVVHGAGVTMRALVDDILDVAKMETGNMTVESAPFDLPHLLRDVARMWQDQAEAKGLAFALDHAEAPSHVEGDAARLRQIIFNLLSNAIKFTDRGDVRVSATGQDGRLCIIVRDTGIGIAAEQHEQIFESFRQADGGTTRRFGGTGLGLTISRNLAKAMGGDVRVASAAGEGATFTLDLPLVPAQAPAAEPAGEAAKAILIVDRNPITRAMLRALMEKRGARVSVAASLAEAIAADPTGIVLLDEATIDPGEEADTQLEQLVARGVEATLLARRLDDTARLRFADRGVRIIEKPIAGAALADTLLGSTHDASVSHLVSRAA